MNSRLFLHQASIIYDKTVDHYCLEPPFNPPEVYPELPFKSKTDAGNKVYPMVRKLLYNLGLDQANYGTKKWNPFRDIICPANTVFIKPNLVSPQHYLGEAALYSSIVHGSVLRPIIDYACIALEGKGVVLIADNPIESADFDALMKFTGIRDMVRDIEKRGYGNEIRVIDLRPRVLKESTGGGFYHMDQVGDPLGYVLIDLGKDSLFSEFDGDEDIHYYTLADTAIDHFDPRCVRSSTTDLYHNSTYHKYAVSKSILGADVLINVAKMKTHCKAGVTLTLKNAIGMVYLKECMPHHRPGLPPKGDSFPFYPASHYVFARKFYRTFRKLFRLHRAPGFRSLRNYLQKNEILIHQHIEHGNWKGNDTIWRTILDLNRIALYADKDGHMKDVPQRKFLGFVDGIISQQGDGPMSGKPLKSSVMVGGFNPVIVDTLAVRVMGIDKGLIKSIIQAEKIKKWKILPDGHRELSFSEIDGPNLRFELPKGWQTAYGQDKKELTGSL